MFDCSGVVHTHPYNIHRYPRMLLCMLSFLAFGQLEHIGYDITCMPRQVSLQHPGTIEVQSKMYEIIRRIFYNFVLCGWGTICWHVHCLKKDYVIKDSWTHKSHLNCEADILIKIRRLKGVLQLIVAWTVQIGGSDDRTDLRCLSLPSSGDIRVHCWLLMQPVGIPLSEFKTIHKLLSILINILDSMYHIEYLVINLIVSIAHMVLFEKFRILHRDVSINNTMIYIADVPESKGNKSSDDDGPKRDDGGLHRSEALGDKAADKQQDKHMQLDRERHQQIWDGILRSGLLINFDYATNLDQAPFSVAGDRTVRISPIFHILTHEFQSGNNPVHVNKHPSQL